MIKRPTLKEFSLTYASLVDQGMVSLGNFLTQIILARILAPAEYGVFALFFGVLFILNVCHWALVAYPLSVRGALADEATLQRVTADSMLLTALLSLPFAVVIIAAALVLKRPALIPWIIAALLAWQLQETTRRGLMAHLRHSSAIFGDMVSYLGQTVALLILAATGHLTLAVVFATVAATSAVAAIIQALQLTLVVPQVRETLALIPLYWNLGRWALLAHVTDASLLQAVPWVLAASHGIVYAASFQAALNILNVVNPVTFGVTNLVVPACLRSNHEGGLGESWRVARRFAEWGFLAVLPYYAIVLIWPHRLLYAYYGAGSPYLTLTAPLRILVPAYLLVYPFAVIAAFFNGVQRPSLVFRCELAGVAAFVLGIYFCWSYAVIGACWSVVFICVSRTAAGFAFLRNLLRVGTAENDRFKAGPAPLSRTVSEGVVDS